MIWSLVRRPKGRSASGLGLYVSTLIPALDGATRGSVCMSGWW